MRLLSPLKILSLIVCLAFLMSCEKKNNSVSPFMSISSLENDEIFFNTKVLYIELATSLLGSQIEDVAYYVDDVLLEELQVGPFVCKVELDGFSLGEHTVKVILRDEFENSVSDTKKIVIYEQIGESPDIVSFSEGIPSTWIVDSWELTANSGFEGSQSVQLEGNSGCVITTKTFEQEGNVNFRIKNTSGTLFFYIDGKLKAKWFGEQDWFCYSYYVAQGTHTFKWKANSSTIALDEIRFDEDYIAHSVGEYFGGGIIYHLDSLKQHGLIVNKTDLGSAPWGCSDINFVYELNTYDGAANTLKVLSMCDEENIAVRLCDNYIVTEEDVIYDDWFLPAPKQLLWLYDNRQVATFVTDAFYWTSHAYPFQEEGIIIAGGVLFSDGASHGSRRSALRRVIPVRAF